jgi:hypothetical protein
MEKSLVCYLVVCFIAFDYVVFKIYRHLGCCVLKNIFLAILKSKTALEIFGPAFENTSSIGLVEGCTVVKRTVSAQTKKSGC